MKKVRISKGPRYDYKQWLKEKWSGKVHPGDTEHTSECCLCNEYCCAPNPFTNTKRSDNCMSLKRREADGDISYAEWLKKNPFYVDYDKVIEKRREKYPKNTVRFTTLVGVKRRR